MNKLQDTNILNYLIRIILEQMQTNVIELEVATTELAFLEDEGEQVRTVIREHAALLQLYFTAVAEMTCNLKRKDRARLGVLMSRSKEHQLPDIQALGQFVETCDAGLLCGDDGETMLDVLTTNATYLKLYLSYRQR